MTPHPRLSRAGLDLVKRFEGLRRRAARLEDGGWTIGYGHTASAREGAKVNEDQAEALLIYDLDKVARAIEPLIFAALNRNQFNALVAFAFNVGLEAFRSSSVLRHVNEGALLQAASALELWRRAELGGESLVVDALVRRRAAEKILFLTPPEGFPPAPTPVVRPHPDPCAQDILAQGPGLAEAAEIEVPLDGEHAVAARIPGPSLEDAARGVSVRLQALYPDEAPHAVEPPEPEPEPEELPAPTPEPFLAPVPDEPPPPPFDLPPADAAEVFAPETPEFGRRPAADAPTGRQAGAESMLVLLVGVAGAVMFVGSLAAMVYGRATLVHLVLGLMGVICMTPAALRLLLRAFGNPGGR